MAIREEIECEQVFDAACATPTEDLPWNDSPKFKGVRIKHLLTGKQTEGRFSYHLVHVEAGCEIGDHVHDTQIELHQVIEGHGTCVRSGIAIAYRPGIAAAMPQGAIHAVKAEQDLYLLATFVPPLA